MKTGSASEKGFLRLHQMELIKDDESTRDSGGIDIV